MTPEQRRLLADLLIQWEDSYRQGQDTPADVLCKDHPGLAAPLARQIAALKRVSWLDDTLEADDVEPGDDSPDEPRPPKVLAGRYRLDQLVATGGFAEVWRAFDQELQRIIAVKIPKRSVVGASDLFLAEARRVARLTHPAILPVYDVGIEDGDCFFVSEYIEGGSLADHLTAGTVTRDDACRWAISVAEALDHAHVSGVIHRDVKPANILIDKHGRALLTDFGIAQSSMNAGGFAPSSGTLRYMAPEQLDGQSAVPQSDIYSLAVVLHEALTGRPPYSSVDPNTLRREIGSGVKISRDVPQWLASVLRKALNRDPGQRFGSAAECAAALRNASRPSHWLMPLGVVAAAGILLGLLGWRSFATPPAGTLPPAVAANPGPSQTRKPNIVRHEMPYPLPPFNRRVWRSQRPDRGKVFRFDTESGSWFEYGEDGNLNFRYRQSRITDDGIDLEDPSRQMWLTLTATTCNSRASPTYPHDAVMATGDWNDHSASPYPPKLDQPITVASERDTLENYLLQLSRHTATAFSINKDALQWQGITKNQSFGLHVSDQPARDVLPLILTKADPEGRLRAVLRAADDGQTAIEITTKQALEQRK